jgi:hypothetical protein
VVTGPVSAAIEQEVSWAAPADPHDHLQKTCIAVVDPAARRSSLGYAAPGARRHAMKVMMFVMATGQTEAGQKPTDEAIRAMRKLNEELQKAGVLLDLGGLTPTSRGVRVRYSGAKRTVIAGPFAEAKETIAGYSLIEVKTLAEAVEWAKRAPFGVGVHDGEEPEVEIRPLFAPTDFDVPGEAEERAKRLGEELGKG